METIYYPEDDILVLKFSDKPIVREVSQDWNINVSYDSSGDIVEMVILEAKEKGLFPVHMWESKVA